MKFGKSLLFVFVMIAGLALPIAGKGAPLVQQTGSFTSYFSAYNMGKPTSIGLNGVAQCAYQLFMDAGSPVHSANVANVMPDTSVDISLTAATTVGTGTYAGVVRCTEPVASVLTYRDESDPRADAFVATSVPDTVLYSPTAYRNYYSYYTKLHIQNADALPHTVKVEFYEPGSSTPLVVAPQFDLPAYGSRVIDLAAYTNLQPDIPYSAKITSLTGRLLAATVQIYGSGDTVKQLYAYEAFPGTGATKSYQPVVMSNYWGYNSATVIQNIGTAAASVRLTYSNGKVLNYSIPPSAAQTVRDYAELPYSNDLYASVVESTNGQPILVMVNESTTATHRATTYLGATKGAYSVAIPLAMRNYNGYNSSIVCQNLGTFSAIVNVSYKGRNNSGVVNLSQTEVTPNLAPNQSVIIYQPANTALGDGYIGAATVTTTQPVSCVANQDRNLPPYSGWVNDYLAANNAIAKP